MILLPRTEFDDSLIFFIYLVDLNPLSAYEYGRSAFPAMKFALEQEPGPGSWRLDRQSGSGIVRAASEGSLATRAMRGGLGEGGRVRG